MTSACKLTVEPYYKQHPFFWHLLPLLGWEHTEIPVPHTATIGGPRFSEFSTFTFLHAVLHRENSAFLEGLLRCILHSCEAEAPGHFCLTTVSVQAHPTAVQREGWEKRTQAWMKCSGQRGLDQLYRWQSKGIAAVPQKQKPQFSPFAWNTLQALKLLAKGAWATEKGLYWRSRGKSRSLC